VGSYDERGGIVRVAFDDGSVMVLRCCGSALSDSPRQLQRCMVWRRRGICGWAGLRKTNDGGGSGSRSPPDRAFPRLAQGRISTSAATLWIIHRILDSVLVDDDVNCMDY